MRDYHTLYYLRRTLYVSRVVAKKYFEETRVEVSLIHP